MSPLLQFILFGDSITQGSHDQARGFAMGAELQQAYARRFDEINRGYAGYNTDHAVQIIDEIIWFGANDANKEPTHNQHGPVERFKTNLTQIITHPLAKAHSPNIILITPPPLEENVLVETTHELFQWGGETRNQKDSEEFADAVKEVGRETGVAVADICSAFMRVAGWEEGDEVLVGSKEAGRSEVLAELLYDGLHLGPAGYKIVFDEVIKVMREKFPEYPPYKMPFAVKVPFELEAGDQFWDVNN